MGWLQRCANQSVRNEDGQSMVEYALILVLVALVVLGLIKSGVSVSTITLFETNYQELNDAFSNALHGA